MNKIKTLIAGLSIVFALALGLTAAPQAQADSASYLADIYSSSYGFYGPPADFLYLGVGACLLANQGYNQSQIVNWVYSNSGSGIYAPQAAYIVIAAEVYLC